MLSEECAGRRALLRNTLLGDSPQMNAVRDLVMRASQVSVPVLILGETGTGKELVAQCLHRLSSPSGRFVAVNCGAIPETLAESELFGHERGAFTGANQQRIGRIGAADRGTLFLDEIEDLSPSLQASLLRFVATGEIQRLGSDRTDRVTTRIVVATNRDLEALVQHGTFRADLFYRLDVLRIPIPPLRSRPQDIPELVERLAERIAGEMGRPRVEIPMVVLNQWMQNPWRGNVRELENRIRRCIAFGGDPLAGQGSAGADVFPDESDQGAYDAGRGGADALSHLLELHEGNQAAVARRLGVTRQAISKRVHRTGVDGRAFRPSRIIARSPAR